MRQLKWCETEYFGRAAKAARRLMRKDDSKALLIIFWYERRKNDRQFRFGKGFPRK